MNAAAAPESAGNGQPPPRKGWSRAQLFRLIAAVFIAHVVLIFIFGARKPVAVRAVKDVPHWQIGDERTGLLALEDPSLFALPHANEFTAPYEASDPFQWSNPPNWLSFTDAMAVASRHRSQANSFVMAQVDLKPPAKLNEPESQFAPDFPKTSTLRLGGDLAQRKWLDAPVLPLWIDNDVLQPAVVQVLVNAEGDVISDVLLDASGLDAADQKALEIARGIHFTRAANPTFGIMIFNWRTVPAPETNSSSLSP